MKGIANILFTANYNNKSPSYFLELPIYGINLAIHLERLGGDTYLEENDLIIETQHLMEVMMMMTGWDFSR